MRSIAKRLGRSPSTLSSELARQGAASYSATDAGRAYRTRRLRSVPRRRLIEDSELSQFVRDHLVLCRWSPQQIAARVRDMHPDESSQRHRRDYLRQHLCPSSRKAE